MKLTSPARHAKSEDGARKRGMEGMKGGREREGGEGSGGGGSGGRGEGLQAVSGSREGGIKEQLAGNDACLCGGMSYGVYKIFKWAVWGN